MSGLHLDARNKWEVMSGVEYELMVFVFTHFLFMVMMIFVVFLSNF